MSQSFSKADVENAKDLLENAGLTEYEATVLSYLLAMGESKASEIIDVSDVPSAKVYETLNELFRQGMIEKKPGRPTLYVPKSPETIINTRIREEQKRLEQKVRELQSLKDNFVNKIKVLWEQGKKEERHHPLLRILKVGEPSEHKTNKLIRSAEEKILVFSKAFEYFPKVQDALHNALTQGVSLRMILYSHNQLSTEGQQIQENIIREMRDTLPSPFTIRYSDQVPLRGTIVDPNKGKGAIFLVEEVGVPLFLREAATTSNPKLVKALAHYFTLLWETIGKE